VKGFAAGIAGTLFTASTVIASSTLAAQLADLSGKLKETKENLNQIDEQLKQAKGSLSNVASMLVRVCEQKFRIYVYICSTYSISCISHLHVN
jgi:hypothetical protein